MKIVHGYYSYYLRVTILVGGCRYHITRYKVFKKLELVMGVKERSNMGLMVSDPI